MLLCGAGSCRLTATDVCGAVTVLYVARDDLAGLLVNIGVLGVIFVGTDALVIWAFGSGPV